MQKEAYIKIFTELLLWSLIYVFCLDLILYSSQFVCSRTKIPAEIIYRFLCTIPVAHIFSKDLVCNNQEDCFT